MNLREYAEDVNQDLEVIIELCNKLGIKKTREEDFLTNDEITMLDIEIDNMKENENPDYELDEELEEKVTNLVNGMDMDLDQVSTKREKVKSNKVQDIKKDESKAKFQKKKKEIYKHRDKLMENKEEDDVVLYKEGMTVSDVANIRNYLILELWLILIKVLTMILLN